MPAKLSIIVPIYNLGAYIRNSLESLFVQVNHDFEIIIVNDGSTDNTLDIVRELFTQSSFHNYKIINKENGGVSSARNRGIMEAEGEYLYFLDGDDYVSPNLISTLVEHLHSNEYTVVAWPYDLVNDEKTIISKYKDMYKEEFNKIDGMAALEYMVDGKMRIWMCSAIYNREFIIRNNIFFNEKCANGEDQEFTFKALSNTKALFFINQVLSFYLQREGSISNSYNIKRFDAVSAMERVASYIKDNLSSKNLDLVNKIKSKYLIDNFFYNFDSNISYLRKNNKLSLFKSIEVLLNDMEIYYPGLNNNIKYRMKNIVLDKKRGYIKYKLYLLSPKLNMLYKIVVTKLLKLLYKQKP